MFLKMKTQMSFPKLMEELNGNIHYQLFCDILIDPTHPLTNYKLLDDIAAELAGSLKIQELQNLLAEVWKPYMKNLDTMFTDATFYESEMRYPTDQKLLWECVEKGYGLMCKGSIYYSITIMIKPSELRLNNIVLFNNQVSEIKGITTNHIHVEGVLRETGNPIIPNEYREIEAADPTITPLPLSHRLLSRVLFLSPSNVEGRGYYLSNKGNYMVLSEGDSLYVGMFVPDLVHIIPGPIDSFHQLQNEFYTIYNREISVDVDSLRMKWRSWNGKGA